MRIIKDGVYIICHLLLVITLAPMYIFWARPQSTYIYGVFVDLLKKGLK